MSNVQGLVGLALVLGMLSPVEAAKVDKTYVSSIGGFGFDVLHELERSSKGGNVFVSPTSLAVSLTMTYNGSAGTTQTAMQKALRLNGYSPAKASQAAHGLIASLGKPGPGVQLSIANSLWARKGVSFKPEFTKANKDYFGAEIKTVTFGPAAVASVNSWVKTKTNGKISDIIKTMPANAILYLVNAVYFKGEWMDEFDKALTKDAPFTLATDKKITVPMMSRTGEYRYHRGKGFQMVAIPYGKGRMSMYIVLPEKPTGLSDLCGQVTAKNWATWTEKLLPASVNLSLPRFKIEYKAEAEMKAALKLMGMAVAFDPNKANFSRMCTLSNGKVYISQVVHKTFVEVNEVGTEAAAATSVGMAFTSAPAKPVDMVVDHPFLSAIVDDETGAVLFVGVVMNPKS